MPPAPSRPHLPGLDGLRGIAILLVMPHNLMPYTEAGGWLSKLLLGWVERGWVGVQLFFVLSGFLITGILLDTARCSHRLRVFYARRALRIFPLYYLTLAGVLILSALHWPPGHPPDGPLLWASYWLYFSNWVAPAMAEPSLPHFWSLAVEEQFYLVWPLLLYRLNARQVLRLALALAAASVAARIAMLAGGCSGDFVYQSTLGRVDALALGGAAAAAFRQPALKRWLQRHRRALPASALAILLGTALIARLHAQGTASQTLGYLGLALASVLSLVWVALSDELPTNHGRLHTRWLHAPWLQRVGRYSYGLYVLHVPLALMVGEPLLHWLGYRTAGTGVGLPLTGVPLLAYLAVAMLVSYGLASLSYHALETRFLRRKPAYGRPTEA